MRLALPISALTSLLLGATAQGQSSIVVRTVGIPAGATIEIEVNGGRLNSVVSEGGTVRFDIPASDTSQGTQIRLRTKLLGYATREIATTTIDLVPSGQVEYDITATSLVAVKQWPIVAWKTTGGAADIYLNRVPRGTTDLRRGIRPDVDHAVEWRQGNTVACRHTVNLPNNVSRTYVCDPATQRITEQ